MYNFLTILFINVKLLGAIGDGISDDYLPIQKAIDSAVKIHGEVFLPQGRYRISKPLLVARFDGEYRTASIKITGESKMWDLAGSKIIADFKQGYAIGLQLNKGTIITGITFEGKYNVSYSFEKHYATALNNYNADSTCRDSQYSPYAGIVIDPYCYRVPPDGGYGEGYKGIQTRSGSTGIRIEDCTIANFVIGIIISPNGYTLNGELMTFQNIRFGDCKIGFAGCQAQEKTNRIINVGAWGYIHTLFGFNLYGSQEPGNYVIDGVNIAGFVRTLINRRSSSYFPLFMSNVYAERLLNIGFWQGTSGDVLCNSVIDFMYPEDIGFFPENNLHGTNEKGLMLQNVTMRYYGRMDYPVLLKGQFKYINTINPVLYRNPIKGYYQNGLKKVYSNFLTFSDGKCTVPVDLITGDIYVIVNSASNDYSGMAIAESKHTLKYCSPELKSGGDYTIYGIQK